MLLGNRCLCFRGSNREFGFKIYQSELIGTLGYEISAIANTGSLFVIQGTGSSRPTRNTQLIPDTRHASSYHERCLKMSSPIYDKASQCRSYRACQVCKPVLEADPSSSSVCGPAKV
jgi:hypothetical protein